MVKYSFRIENPNNQYIQIQVVFEVLSSTTILRLPSWRPGRYEIGNFAKNVKGFKVYNDQNKRIETPKITKDSWGINTADTKTIRVEYSYYATELNAGSTYLSSEQLYVNPVNCCVFTLEHAHQPTTLEVYIPTNWEVAGSMDKAGNVLSAENFDALADSPFICSANLQHGEYHCNGTLFHIWFNGEVKPDWPRLIADFKAFTAKQIEKFTEFPVKEYHFLCQIVPTKIYHGVEHCKSTVIALGPSYAIFGALYKELLGVSSHELYHTWNVKTIRPAEMFPYDFTKENYSRLGYICEGVTTYMGDLFLLKSGVFSLGQYFNELNQQLQKHFDNHARFNYSVGESSFDTWLDGYVTGAPGRKVSIYTEGCLLAFVMDVMILRATTNKSSLDTVMKQLFFDYADKGVGVTEEIYLAELQNISGISFQEFFVEFVHGTNPYEAILTESFDYLGLELKHVPSPNYSMGRLGFKTVPTAANFTVTALYPGGPADLAGMMIGDEILAVNAILCAGELDQWLSYFDNDVKKLTVIRSSRIVELILPEVMRNFYSEYSIIPIENPTKLQDNALAAWIS
jgi:predicted metalloprotease with PDZ domain